MEASAIIKGTKNLEAAKQLHDWSVNQTANEMYGNYYAITAHPEVKSVPANYPVDG